MSTFNFPLTFKYTSVTTPSYNYNLTWNATVGSVSHSIRWPSNNFSGYLRNDGNGNLTWANATSPSFSSPVFISASTGIPNPLLSLTQAGTGDTTMQFNKTGVPSYNWTMGCKTSNGSFEIANSANLGLLTKMVLNSTGMFINGTLSTSAYAFPAADGAAGLYLRTDGAGALYWGLNDVNPIFEFVQVDANNFSSAGNIVITQAGAGDASIAFNILNMTENIYYQVGIDNSDNLFKISNSNNLGFNEIIQISPSYTYVKNQLRIGPNFFPTTSGSSGQFLRTDGAGTLSWATVSGGGGGGPAFTTPVTISITSATTASMLTLSQLSSGVAGQTFNRAGVNYSLGIDAAGVFKLSGSSTIGTADKISIDLTGINVHVPLTIAGLYTLPSVDGTPGQMMATDGFGVLSWVSVATPSNVIYKNGQAGPVALGTVDATDVSVLVNNVTQMSAQADGHITLGNVATLNAIYLNGGVRYRVRTDVSGGANINLTINDYFLIVGNIGTSTVTLPSSTANSGQYYIIRRGFAGGSGTSLSVVPQVGDNIDGDSNIYIPAQGASVELISDGAGSWQVM